MSKLTESIADLKANAGQWQAFRTEGHCVVLAPPGSGKTKLLTTRVAYDLANRIPRPQGAACITLTNPAADQLRERITDLGVVSRSTLFVGTVHGFAFRRIITPFARAAGRSDAADLQVADPRLARSLLDQIVNRNFERYEKRERRLAKSTIEHNRKQLATDQQWLRSEQRIVQAGRQYEQELRQRGLMDFDDIVRFAVELVEGDETVRKALVACYPHLYVDEYQDLAPGLDRLVRALCFDYRTPVDLFAVGDPDQAIFGFTGTRPELLLELAARPGVTRVSLTVNYRCGIEIIRCANRLLADPDREITGQRSGGRVEAHHEPGGFSSQANAAAQIIRTAMASGTPLHEVVVLCATNTDCESAAAGLRAQSLPVYVRGSEYDRTPATQLIEGLAAWTTLGRERSGHRLSDLLYRWRDAMGDQWSKRGETKLVEKMLELCKKVDAPATQLIDELDLLGLTSALEKAKRGDDAASITDMMAALTNGSLRGHTITELGERARNADRIEVTTMTSGKGLEFDVVIILGAEDGVIPFFASTEGSKEMSEDRRKFYVSITRARESVDIFYSGFTVTQYGARHNPPSRFIRQLGIST
ncbi:ATP-dependent helicase [Actinomadura sp. GC306]|uniref:ATP-dependent helicase n=1 Tax=Actinomadura sp. GC306 TaxID=2530367 RepID=UPI001053DB87|nr:ATP-dependent helicase [Actinomadura sp. GC306]TDC71258.1 ATP-dependent helicase [Actinomadura sp. GC306]